MPKKSKWKIEFNGLIKEESVHMVPGIFKLVDTYGLPFDIAVEKLKDNGMMCNWLDFYHDAMKAGWKSDRTIIMMEEVVGDIYGPAFREGWSKCMEDYLAK